MADLSGNPWSFGTSDAATTAAISSIVRNGQGSALITTSTAHGISIDTVISVQGTTVAGWKGGYHVLAVPSTTTLLVPIRPSQFALANNGANGNIYTVAYPELIEVTQILWNGPTATNVLSLTDMMGREVWNPVALTGGTLTYMKAFPIFGLVVNALPSGTVQISV